MPDKSRHKGSEISWETLFHGMWGFLNEEHAEITYDFDDLHIHVPSREDDPKHQAIWTLDGALKISSKRLDE